MTNDERRAFVNEAKAANEAGKAELVANIAEHHSHDGQRAINDWQRRREQPSEPLPARAERAWSDWLQGHLKRERTLMAEAIGEELGRVRAEIEARIAEEVGSLRAEITVQRAHDDVDQVIDLPAWRRRSNAA